MATLFTVTTAVGGSYEIKKEDESMAYTAVASGLGYALKDAGGSELGQIQPSEGQGITWHPKYEIHRDGRGLWAELTTDMRGPMRRKEMSVHVPGDTDFKVVGGRLGREFSISKEEQEVATISKRMAIGSNKYIVTIQEGADEEIMLMICLIVDRIFSPPA